MFASIKVITKETVMHEPRIMNNLILGHLTAKKKNNKKNPLHHSITCNISLLYFFQSSEIFYSCFIN